MAPARRSAAGRTARSGPRAERPRIPGYGIAKARAGLLTWADVERAIVASPRYWISTTDGDGRPHVIQQWGAWVGGALYFEGGMTPRYARNLARDARVAVAIERGKLAIMLEGTAVAEHPDDATAEAIIAAYRKKRYGYVPKKSNWADHGIWCMRVVTVFAWDFTRYVKSATRFRFGAD